MVEAALDYEPERDRAGPDLRPRRSLSARLHRFGPGINRLRDDWRSGGIRWLDRKTGQIHTHGISAPRPSLVSS